MTYEEARQYAQEHGENADERYLIETIQGHTTDPATCALIEFWFAQYDTEE